MSISAGGFVVPEIVATHFHLKPGEIVADYGAGIGFFLGPIAKAIGVDGRIYACEIQKDLVEKLSDKARSLHITNVTPLWCDLEEPGGIKIADKTLDVAILVNTLFQIEDKNAGIREMSRPLRSGGRFYVVDWTESFAGLGPRSDHVVSEREATILFEANGFMLENQFPAGDHHYGLAFRKI